MECHNFIKMTTNDAIALYAALLSSILAVREYLKSRPHIKSSLYMTGETGADDIITLYNATERNVVVLSYELIKGQSNIFGQIRQQNQLETGLEGDYINISIEPYKSYELRIEDQFKFTLSARSSLYLKLHLAGKSAPIIRKLI